MIGARLLNGAMVILLAVVFLVCFILPGFIFPVSKELQDAVAASGRQGETMLYILLVSIASALVISFPIRHARAGGIGLIVAVIVTAFGFETFMGQIESLYFHAAFPLLSTGGIIGIMIRGFLTYLLFVPVAVAVWKKIGKGDYRYPRIPWRGWLWKALLLGVAYAVIYFMFGYFVAWQFPETRLLYSGTTELLGFVEHYRRMFLDNPLFLPLQVVRGILWVVFAVPLILVLDGKRKQAIISLALLGALFGFQILIPNPLFPDAVRIAHFLEVLPSTALYGGLIGAVITLPLDHPHSSDRG